MRVFLSGPRTLNMLKSDGLKLPLQMTSWEWYWYWPTANLALVICVLGTIFEHQGDWLYLLYVAKVNHMVAQWRWVKSGDLLADEGTEEVRFSLFCVSLWFVVMAGPCSVAVFHLPSSNFQFYCHPSNHPSGCIQEFAWCPWKTILRLTWRCRSLAVKSVCSGIARASRKMAYRVIPALHRIEEDDDNALWSWGENEWPGKFSIWYMIWNRNSVFFPIFMYGIQQTAYSVQIGVEREAARSKQLSQSP